MIFNKRKFNIMMSLTLALICLAVVFSTIDYSSFETVEQPDQSYAEQDKPSTDDDLIENDDQEQSAVDENEEDEDSKFQKLNITFTNGWTALNYALGLLENNDYKISFSQQVDAKDTTFNQGGIQKIDKEIYNVDNVGYVKAVADGSGVPLGMGENYTDYIVVNQSSVSSKRVGQTQVDYSLEDYLSKFGYTPNEIPYSLKMNAAELYFSIVRPRNGDGYYELTLTLNSKAWENYLTGLEAVGGEGSNPQIQSIVVTITINKDYGYIMSLSAKENYTIKRGVFTANSVSSVLMQFSYYGDFTSQIEEIKSQIN